jgi:hypothetical protein
MKSTIEKDVSNMKRYDIVIGNDEQEQESPHECYCYYCGKLTWYNRYQYANEEMQGYKLVCDENCGLEK